MERVIRYIEEKGWEPKVIVEDGLTSIEFSYRGVAYHIWEFDDNERGVDTNIRHGGKMEEITGDYEEKIFQILGEWK